MLLYNKLFCLFALLYSANNIIHTTLISKKYEKRWSFKIIILTKKNFIPIFFSIWICILTPTHSQPFIVLLKLNVWIKPWYLAKNRLTHLKPLCLCQFIWCIIVSLGVFWSNIWNKFSMYHKQPIIYTLSKVHLLVSTGC